MLTNQPEISVYSGFCPDAECQSKLFFPSYAASSIECTGCGKHYNKDSLLQLQLIKDPNIALTNLLRSVLLTRSALKKGTDLIKVKGYSNYHCRLISPLLTHYGMDNKTSEVKLLKEMGQGDVFDCSHVGDRAFGIEEEYLDTPGYGKDRSGSIKYLKEVTEGIKIVNDEERLVPLHVDGDGHCLVHAISRALVGREIFWHPLMVNLQEHFKKNLTKYRELFMDFIGHDEWDLIISEAGPYFQPADDQPLGLRNIHIFGLANVLHRPILLLDSISGIQSSADYSGTFLPALVSVDACRKKDGKLIPPLAIAWSNSGRNHYIPLVNIRNKQPAKVPSWIVPKAWGIPDEYVRQYIEFDDNDVCVIGGSRAMSDVYLQRLMKAMDSKFLGVNGVSASLVTEVHQFIFKPSGVVGVRPQTVIDRTKQSVQNKALMRCIACQALSEYECPVNQEWLVPGGRMYTSAAQVEGGLAVGQMYSFQDYHLICSYDADKDVLKPIKYQNVDLASCSLCNGSLRTVEADGSPVYVNGDRTSTPVTGKTKCSCGFKHFWDGKEYDNLPEMIPVSLEWGGKSIKENVYWFQHESDESANSNVYEVAGRLVQNHFPGEFGSERLVQKVVDTILRQTARKEGDNKGARPDIPNLRPCSTAEAAAIDSFSPSKIILTGQKKKTFHKEELTQSETEKRVKIKTEHHAAITQHRQTKLQKSPTKSPPKQQQDSKPAAPSLPTPTSPRAPRTDKKIRLSSSTGGQHDLTLPLDVTFSQLQEAIHNKLGVPPGEQKIRYGFPPRLLNPPEEGKEEEPIPIQHGDKVMVEVLPPPEPDVQQPADVEMQEEKVMGGAVGGEGKDGHDERPEEKKEDTSPMDVDLDTSALASVLMSALSGNLGNDLWEAACRTPQMFERGGYYYNLVANLGPLVDDQHFAIPQLPNKVFAYNKDKDRIELCLGKIHIPVQPLNQETLALAHNQPITTSSTSTSSSSIMNTEASFSGVISKTTGRTQKAFSGEGRSLSGSSPVSPKKPAEQTPSIPSGGIFEAFKSLATTTSHAQSPGTTRASRPSGDESMEEEQSKLDKTVEGSPAGVAQSHGTTRASRPSGDESMEEEQSKLDKTVEESSTGVAKGPSTSIDRNNAKREHSIKDVASKTGEMAEVSPVLEENKASNDESAMLEERSITDKPVEDSSMMKETDQTEKTVKEAVPTQSNKLEEGSSGWVLDMDQTEKTVKEVDPSQSDKLEEQSSGSFLDTDQTDKPVMEETTCHTDNLVEQSSGEDKITQADNLTNESSTEKELVKSDMLSEKGTSGEATSESDKTSEASSMVQESIQQGKFTDEEKVMHEDDESKHSEEATMKALETDESEQSEESRQTDKEGEKTKLMEESSQLEKPADALNMEAQSDQTKLVEDSIQSDKKTVECPTGEKPDVSSTSSDSYSSTDVNMKGDTSSSLVEEEGEAVAMETDHHGNASENADQQSSGEQESQRYSGDGSDGVESRRKQSMDVDQVDQVQS